MLGQHQVKDTSKRDREEVPHHETSYIHTQNNTNADFPLNPMRCLNNTLLAFDRWHSLC